MALTDEVQNRYSSQLLINVTRPQNSNATTIDTDRLNEAIQDVTGDFEMMGIDLDQAITDDDKRHIRVAVAGVYALLLQWSGRGGGDEMEAYNQKLNLLRESTSRDRISPTTDSLLTPTKDNSGDLPATDRKQFQGYIPGAPSEPATGS